MPLEASSIQALTPQAASYKVSDGKGLFLLVRPNGARYWRFRYRWGGKENSLSCGVYPETGLDEARARRDAARQLLAAGINPGQHAKSMRGAELAHSVAAARFLLGSDGSLSFRSGNRRVALTPAETDELRAFLDATRTVKRKEQPCP